MTIKLKTWLRLRAAVAALALALGWLSVPLSLASWEPDVCEMECCIAEGHCCCATRRAYVKGREPKLGDVSVTFETALTNPCPASCAASGNSSQNNLPRAAHTPSLLVEPASIPLPRNRGQFLLAYPFAAQPSSPRAPPARDGLIA
ncbi:MAG TPA: hypothetical protein VJ810_41455 [Blastocatellia bacterium]|nr:hypothetical protein [Blastocatellia bacterium]